MAPTLAVQIECFFRSTESEKWALLSNPHNQHGKHNIAWPCSFPLIRVLSCSVLGITTFMILARVFQHLIATFPLRTIQLACSQLINLHRFLWTFTLYCRVRRVWVEDQGWKDRRDGRKTRQQRLNGGLLCLFTSIQNNYFKNYFKTPLFKKPGAGICET